PRRRQPRRRRPRRRLLRRRRPPRRRRPRRRPPRRRRRRRRRVPPSGPRRRRPRADAGPPGEPGALHTAARRRLDLELTRRGMSRSAEQARILIAAGRVLVPGTVATNPARLVGPGEPVEISGPPPRFV